MYNRSFYHPLYFPHPQQIVFRYLNAVQLYPVLFKGQDVNFQPKVVSGNNWISAALIHRYRRVNYS